MSTLRQQVETWIADAVPEFKEVGGAANLEALLAGRVSTPGCYVMTSKKQAQANQRLGGVVQQRIVTLGILIIVKNVRSASGLDASDEAEQFSDLVKNALLGKRFDGYQPLVAESGSLFKFFNGMLIWGDTYRAEQTIGAL